jgi:hypothetical protein
LNGKTIKPLVNAPRSESSLLVHRSTQRSQTGRVDALPNRALLMEDRTRARGRCAMQHDRHLHNNKNVFLASQTGFILPHYRLCDWLGRDVTGTTTARHSLARLEG